MEARQAFAEDYIGAFVIVICGLVLSWIAGPGLHENYCQGECPEDPACDPYDSQINAPCTVQLMACRDACVAQREADHEESLVLVAFGFISAILTFVARYASSRRYMKCAKRAEKANELNSKIQDLYLGEPVAVGVGPVAVTIGAV